MSESLSEQFVVVALYRFIELPAYRALQAPLRALCESSGIEGTLLLAREGINGTIAGSAPGIERALEFIRQQPGLEDLEVKLSYASCRPFHRLKVKVKKEIVTMGVPTANPAEKVGTYIAPENWNEMLERDDVLVVDTRNDFEVRVGSFPGAINPNTRSFTEFPKFVQERLAQHRNKKIAMFCTGGIRCEKATSYLLEQGFEEVYHLQGGILKYLETVPPAKNRWLGECFVFDQRVSLTHGLKEGTFELCFGCQSPLSMKDRGSPNYESGVSCDYCIEQLSDDRKQRLRQRVKQVELAKRRGDRHIGLTQEKSRA